VKGSGRKGVMDVNEDTLRHGVGARGLFGSYGYSLMLLCLNNGMPAYFE